MSAFKPIIADLQVNHRAAVTGPGEEEDDKMSKQLEIAPEQNEQDGLRELANQKADNITQLFSQILLIAERDAAISAAIAPLSREQEAIARESAEISEANTRFADVLPSKIRVLERRIDELIAEDKPQKAAALRAEADQLAGEIPAMERQLQELSERYDKIDHEKYDVRNRIRDNWSHAMKLIVRAAERGLFITLLDGLSNQDLNVNAMTADERAQEWMRGNHWYRGRGRR